MTHTITIREGRANVFVAVEHANCVGFDVIAGDLDQSQPEPRQAHGGLGASHRDRRRQGDVAKRAVDRKLETGCEIDFHFLDASTAQIAIDDYIYTLKKRWSSVSAWRWQRRSRAAKTHAGVTGARMGPPNLSHPIDLSQRCGVRIDNKSYL
jgi:hypothetical protein